MECISPELKKKERQKKGKPKSGFLSAVRGMRSHTHIHTTTTSFSVCFIEVGFSHSALHVNPDLSQ